MRLLPVRLLVLTVLFVALYLGCQVVPGLVVHVPRDAPERGWFDLASAFFLAVVMIAAYLATARFIERRKADDLRLANGVALLLLGSIVGAALFAAVYAVLWVKGFAHIAGFGGTSGLEHAMAIAIASAVGEEIAFRGILFRILEQWSGTLIALVVSASLFGLLHGLNHGATWWSTLSVALEGGGMLAAAYAASRSLWLPIGIHFGWGLTEGGIFNAAVSGGSYHGLVASTLSGPRFWTGGEFGPEASIAAIAVCLALLVVFFVVIIVRGEWRALGSSMPRELEAVL